MKNKESKSLRKLTDEEVKVKELLKKDKVNKEDLDSLSPGELGFFIATLNKNINELKGIEFDKFYSKIEGITEPDTKNQIWERNHNQITWAISVLMQEYGRMPTVSEVATKSELSRQTVHKHLKGFGTDSNFLEIAEQFRFMTSKVLARVFKFAVNGDIRAARLYFDVIGTLPGASVGGNVTNTQNNFIQVNQVKISQETIRQLNPQQLNQIEELLKNLVPASN